MRKDWSLQFVVIGAPRMATYICDRPKLGKVKDEKASPSLSRSIYDVLCISLCSAREQKPIKPFGQYIHVE